MKAYELSVVAKTGSDEEIKNTTKTIEETLQKLEASISQITEPSKVRLGYTIKKEKEGILTSFYFQAEPKTLEALKKEMDAINVLRYFIVEKRKVKKQIQYRTRAPQITQTEETAPVVEELDQAPAPAAQEAPVKETKEKPEKRRKAELEDINKELEEMLK